MANRPDTQPDPRPDGPILRPGETCWRLARADRLAVIVDAAGYFAAAKAAILQARHSVFLIGWDFDLRIGLERRDPRPDVPDELGAFLAHIVETRPDLRIFVLRWDLAFLRNPFRATIPLKIMDWISGQRLQLRADHEHPAGACHHQKIVVIDDSVAFCGGIDMTTRRWDTPAHADEDPDRADPGVEGYDPWHDATTCLEGEAARVLGELARERWRRATGEVVPPPPSRTPCWPADLAPDFTDVEVGIARTEPLYGDAQPEIREIEALYLAAIAAARRTIYLETQYFASRRIVSALMERLREPDGPEVVVINPRTADGWLEEEVMGAARALLLADIAEADRHGRFALYTPVTAGGTDIYVHAKVLVIDDTLLRVGSSNVNNRSMGFDTECDLAVAVGRDDPRAGALRETIRGIRSRLVAEHLGIEPAELDAELAREDGSLLRVVERLRTRGGRTLVPFEPPAINDAEIVMARSRVLDPDRPESVARALRRGGLRPALRMGVRLGLGVTAALGVARLARRLRR